MGSAAFAEEDFISRHAHAGFAMFPSRFSVPSASQRCVFAVKSIIQHSPRRRALPCIAEGLWSLSNYSAIARAGGLRLG